MTSRTVPALVLLLMFRWVGVLLAAQQSSAQPPARNETPPAPFNPAEYVRIWEETPKGRILQYAPRADHCRNQRIGSNGPTDRACEQKPTLFRVDQDSKLIVEIMTEKPIVADMALNSLFMRAQITRSGNDAASAPVEVLNYSEIPKDASTQAMQATLALRAAGDVRTIIKNLYDLTKDIVTARYEEACFAPLPAGEKAPPAPPAKCRYQPQTGSEERMKDVLRASRPRVEAVTAFFTADANSLVLSLIGDRVFNLDVASLKGVARKMLQDVDAFTLRDDRLALRDLDFNVQRLWNDMQSLRVFPDLPAHFNAQWDADVRPRLARVLAPGTIDLPTNKAEDGNTLTLTIQARAAGGAGAGGVSQDFQIAIRKLHPRVTTEPSAYYLRRLGDIRNDAGEIVEGQFAPAPGVTFGVVFYGRSRLISALAPGIGLNVSFMNFAANDFDPSIANKEGQVVGGFRSTTSDSIQVGTGMTVSLFANAVQFTYGYNMNVDRQHRYFGIGFGFLQVGEQIAKFAKKK